MFPIFIQDSGGIGVECVETYKKPTTHDPFNVVAFKEMIPRLTLVRHRRVVTDVKR
jgi:hypothetical protein